MVRNIMVTFWKLLAPVCQIEILETLVCLLLILNVESALRQDALRWQMASAVIPIYEVFYRRSFLANDWLVSGSFAI